MDTAPVLVTCLIFGAFLVMFSWVLVLTNTKARWLIDLATANSLVLGGASLFLSQGIWPDFISVVIANIFISVGILFLSVGIGRFAEKVTHWVIYGVAVCVVAAGFIVLTFAWPRYPLMVILQASVFIVVASHIVFVLGWCLDREQKANPRLFGFLIAATCVVIFLGLTRNTLMFHSFGPGEPIDSVTPLVSYVVVTVAMLVWTMGFIILSVLRDQRLLTESLGIRDQILRLMGHDLRGPFGGVAHLLGVMETSTFSPEETRDMIATAARTARASCELLEDLFDWASSRQGQLVLRDDIVPAQLLLAQATAPLVEMAKSKKVALELLAEQNLYLQVDVKVFSTVLRNLVSNAVKFTPSLGTVTVDAHWDVGGAVISVGDTGSGISHDLVDRLNRNEAIESTDGTSGEQGTGLGLSLCFDFVKLHGGTLVFESSPSGTNAKIQIPAFRVKV